MRREVQLDFAGFWVAVLAVREAGGRVGEKGGNGGMWICGKVGGRFGGENEGD